jgi:hypothetical protein
VTIGADTVPEDPTKTKVVTSPDARNHRAQRDGMYLEGPTSPLKLPELGGDEEKLERAVMRRPRRSRAERLARRTCPCPVQTRRAVGVERREIIRKDEERRARPGDHEGPERRSRGAESEHVDAGAPARQSEHPMMRCENL